MSKMKEFFSASEDNESAANTISLFSLPFTMPLVPAFMPPETSLPVIGLLCALPIGMALIDGSGNANYVKMSVACGIVSLGVGLLCASVGPVSMHHDTTMQRNIEDLYLPPSLDMRPQIVPKPKVLELQSQGEKNYTIETLQELTCQPGAVCNITVGKPGQAR